MTMNMKSNRSTGFNTTSSGSYEIAESKTYEIVAPLVFLVVLFAVVVCLVLIYRAVVKQSCSCLSDPGGRKKERQKRKKDGYDKVTSEDSSDDEIFVPPTLTVEGEIDPDFDQVVEAGTHSPYSAYSAYGDTVSLDQLTYVTERGLGRLRLNVAYYSSETRLKVHIVEGDGLPSKEQGGAANFKIHVTLLPKREQRFKSKTKSRYSPKFDESFQFKNVLQKDLFTSAVRFRLYGVIATGNKLVGETFFQLADIAKLDNQIIQNTWRAFRPLNRPKTKK